MIIRIKNLRLRTILGVNPGERETLQDVVINVEIEVDGQKAVQTDSLAHTVNYRDLTKRIIDKVEHFWVSFGNVGGSNSEACHGGYSDQKSSRGSG
jgi:FolB domain-containing protein